MNNLLKNKYSNVTRTHNSNSFPVTKFPDPSMLVFIRHHFLALPATLKEREMSRLAPIVTDCHRWTMIDEFPPLGWISRLLSRGRNR